METRVTLFITCFSIFFVCKSQDTTRVSLLFVGDVMQHDSQIRAAFDPESNSYDYTDCFGHIAPVVQSADLAFANLEVTLAGPPFKGYPQFSAPDPLAVGLKESGFDVLVTANNHCVDRRRKGLERTIDILDSLSIPHTGTFKDSAAHAVAYPLIVNSKNIKFSLLNYTYGTNGIPVTSPNIVNLIDTTVIKQDLMRAKEQSTDAIIVFMHWGQEYKDAPDKSQKVVADFCFKNGANLVIGSHPHVLQPMEWRKEANQLVAYSLGNFVSGQQSRYRDGGAMLWVEFQKVQSDSLSITSIKNASYELEWVYRNYESPRKYFVLPLKEFESDTTTIKEKTAQERMKQFVNDSRTLLKNNLDLGESKRIPGEINYFRILISTLADSTSLDSLSLLQFYGSQVERVNDSTYHWMTDKFYDRDVAQNALSEITSSTPYDDAKLIWYYLGRRREVSAAAK